MRKKNQSLLFKAQTCPSIGLLCQRYAVIIPLPTIRDPSGPPLPSFSPQLRARSSGETGGRQTNRMPFGRRCLYRPPHFARRPAGLETACLNERAGVPTAVCPSGRRSRPTTPPPPASSAASAVASALRKLNDTGGGIAPTRFSTHQAEIGMDLAPGEVVSVV